MSFQRRILLPALAMFAMVLGAVLGSRLTIDNDIALLLPDANPDLTRAAQAMQRLLHRTVVDIGAPDGALDHDGLAAIADRLAERLRASGHATEVRARVDPELALPLIELLRDRAPLLMADSMRAAWVDRTARDEAIRIIQDLARRIQQIDGSHLKARAAVDPLGLTDPVLEPLADLAEGPRAARLIGGRITSADGRHLLVLVEAACSPDDADRNEAFLSTLGGVAAELEAATPGLEIRWFGTHRATLDNVDQIRSDVFRTSTIGAALIALLAVLCFGRIWLSLLALTPALFGGLFAIGTVALFRDTVPGAVLGFGAVLLGLTVDFAIHVLFRIDSHRDPGQALQLPVRELFLGGTTTSLAFVALQASSLPALRDIGVFGAVGVFAAVLFARYVLPAIVSRPGRSRPLLDLRRVVQRVARPRVPAVVTALLVTPLVAAGIFFLEFDGDPTRLGALSPAAAADQAAIEANWGTGGQLTALVVEGPDLDAALAANDRLRDWLDRAVAAGRIRGHGSVATVLPAPSTQLARLQAWREFWTPARRAELHATLAAATAASPFRDGAFAAFETWLDRDPVLLIHAEQVDGPMRDLLADRVQQIGGRWQITTPVFADDWQQTAALAADLRRDLPAVGFLNRQALARTLAAMVTGEMGLLAVVAFLLVGTVVFVWHGQLLIALAILAPLALSLLWTLGLLGWFGIPISLANAIFVVFLFGVAVDYAVFLAGSRLERFRTGQDHTVEAQASVLLCTMTTCCGFGSLALAGHPVMHAIGLTALIGIVATALATQILVPATVQALLVRPGPNGTPGVRNAWFGLWVSWKMLSRGLWHLLTHRAVGDPAGSQRAAIDAIHRMAVTLRDQPRFGRRQFLDTDKLLDEPCIVVANHESMYDIMAVLALPRPTQILVKQWTWDAPVMGHIIRRAGYLRARTEAPQELVAQVGERLAAGHSLLIFPEGRRTRSGRIGRFHNGAFALARQLGVRVQPIAMVNTRQVVPCGGWWLGDHDARIAVLDPLDPADFAGEGGDRRMARAARDRIRDRCAELWLDTQFGDRWWAMVGGMYRYLGPVVSHYATSKCRLDPLIRELPLLCPGAGAILVAGGGLGVMTGRLATAFPGRPITSIDNDERKLATARAALGPTAAVEFRTGDLRDCELPTVDTALLIDVLHYWDDATQRQILSRVAAALRPGGRLLFREGCTTRDHRERLMLLQERISLAVGFTRSHGRLLLRSECGWRALLTAAGLTVAAAHPELGTLSNLVLVCHKPADPAPTVADSASETVAPPR